MINYITEYIYFINALNNNFFLYISYQIVQHNTVNNFKASNFLFN